MRTALAVGAVDPFDLIDPVDDDLAAVFESAEWEAECAAEFAALVARVRAEPAAPEPARPLAAGEPGEVRPATAEDLHLLLAGADPVTLNDDGTLAAAAAPAERAAALVEAIAAGRRAEARAVWAQVAGLADLLAVWSTPQPVAGDELGQGPAAAPPPTSEGALDPLGLAPAFVVAEVAVACGMSEYAVARRLDAAVALVTEGRLPRTAALLRAGAVDWPKVQVLVRETGPLAPAAARAVEELVADAASSATVPGLTAAVQAAVAVVDAAAHAERSVRARADRHVRVRAEADGMGELYAYAPLEAVVAVAAELDAAVATAKAAGDARTRGQIRCDELVARLTRGAFATAVPMTDAPPAPPAPRARLSVTLTMSVQTWLGISEDPARLEGYGPVAAQVARAITADLAETATWRCAVVDGEHGTVLGLGRPTRIARYVPPARLAEFVRTIEPMCTFPGCRVRAARCDLDHTVPHPGGPTCSCNLAPLCRRHHRLKTTALVTVRASTDPSDPPGTLLWTTRTGRTRRHTPPPLPGPHPPGAPPGAPPLLALPSPDSAHGHHHGHHGHDVGDPGDPDDPDDPDDNDDPDDIDACWRAGLLPPPEPDHPRLPQHPTAPGSTDPPWDEPPF